MNWRTVLTMLLPALVLLPFVVFGYGSAASKASREADSIGKQNLHAIQLAVERYAANDPQGSYPASLSQLQPHDYLFTASGSPIIPMNPHARGCKPQPVPEVPPGEYTAGGVTYVPHFTQQGEGPPQVSGYALILYCGDELFKLRQRTGFAGSPENLPGGAEEQVQWQRVLLVLNGGDWIYSLRTRP